MFSKSAPVSSAIACNSNKIKPWISTDHTGVGILWIVMGLRFDLEEILIILAAKASDLFDKVFIVGPEHKNVPRLIGGPVLIIIKSTSKDMVITRQIYIQSTCILILMITRRDNFTSCWQSLRWWQWQGEHQGRTWKGSVVDSIHTRFEPIKTETKRS